MHQEIERALCDLDQRVSLLERVSIGNQQLKYFEAILRRLNILLKDRVDPADLAELAAASGELKADTKELKDAIEGAPE